MIDDVPEDLAIRGVEFARRRCVDGVEQRRKRIAQREAASTAVTDVAQLFWVIKNGINMTGMPSFAQAGVQDDEIWSIAAFVKKLPSVSDADYKTWTASAEPKQ